MRQVSLWCVSNNILYIGYEELQVTTRSRYIAWCFTILPPGVCALTAFSGFSRTWNTLSSTPHPLHPFPTLTIWYTVQVSKLDTQLEYWETERKKKKENPYHVFNGRGLSLKRRLHTARDFWQVVRYYVGYWLEGDCERSINQSLLFSLKLVDFRITSASIGPLFWSIPLFLYVCQLKLLNTLLYQQLNSRRTRCAIWKFKW